MRPIAEHLLALWITDLMDKSSRRALTDWEAMHLVQYSIRLGTMSMTWTVEKNSDR